MLGFKIKFLEARVLERSSRDKNPCNSIVIPLLRKDKQYSSSNYFISYFCDDFAFTLNNEYLNVSEIFMLLSGQKYALGITLEIGANE